MWLDRIQTEGLLEAAVVYGYFPCVQRGQRPGRAAATDGGRSAPGSPSRGSGATAAVPRRLLPAARSRARSTWSPSSSSPWARRWPEATAELFATNAYRDYLELHGLSVQLTEALAEFWHARVREELGFAERRPGRPGRRSSRQATAARATRSATRPARTWRTARRSSGCSTRSGSASSCPRSSSCTPSSPPTPSSSTTPRRSTSASDADRAKSATLSLPAGRLPSAKHLSYGRRSGPSRPIY